MLKNLNLTEGQEDLRIVDHLDMHKLPESVQQMISLASTPEEQDIILMAVQIERIAMVLTVMRNIESRILFGKTNEAFLCNNDDYEAAEMIGNKMLLHMAAAYRMIDGDAQDVVPEIKPLDQRTILLNALPVEYESKQLYSEAQSQGVCVRTATRWNDYWQQQGLIQKIRHGYYKKIA